MGRETQGHEILRATIHGDLVGVEAEIVPPKIGFRASVSITRVIGIINSAQPLIA
ncbi:hypothetical protein HYZ78_03645 [Candidatus Microgenomates bacterium]|nr:hypothetical protein [Candidatus Microgenomates bacterium]